MTIRSHGQLETANDRFKRTFGRLMWGSIMMGVIFHFALFQFFPKLTAAMNGHDEDGPVRLLAPPDVDIPPPPQRIQLPRPPVVGDDIDIEEPSPTTDIGDYDPERLPPPRDEAERPGPSDFVPFTVAPRLRDPAVAQRIVEQHYPRILQEAGIGGRVTVTVYIDTAGAVQEVRLLEGSGNQALDAAAMKAVTSFQFIPGMNRDRKVSLWVKLPITFKTK